MCYNAINLGRKVSIVDALNEEKALSVLYLDGDAVAVVKPQGILSEDAGADSLPALLRGYLGSAEIYPVHRLDKVTGGAILYAKTKESAAALSRAIAERRIGKVYLAVVCGRPDKPSGRLTDYLYHDKRQNKVFAVRSGRKGAKEAILDYETIGTVTYGEGELSLLRVTLLTGRTHQIRAQFASRRLPVFGDRRYGAKESLTGGAIALWSHELSFPLLSGERKTVVSMPPKDDPWRLFSQFREK